MMNRRKFITDISKAGFALGFAGLPLSVLAAPSEYTKLTILHTNDVHSRIEPFEDGKYKGLGGAAKRSAIIKQIRQEEKNVLLLDCGDIFQGTPYFNFFAGELDIKLMNMMQYDVATLGNHDFDGGLDMLKTHAKNAKFPFVSSNYDFEKTVMNGLTKPYHVIEKDELRIGIFGLGIEIDGLVPEKLYKKTRYNDPIRAANKTARLLKTQEKCDLIICLSHLGYEYEVDRISDIVLAQNTRNIDLILGGHTHTFMTEPDAYPNQQGQRVWISQAAWAGIVLGRIDVYFRKDRRKKHVSSRNVNVR
ncbi:MAG: bifunctional metallophosphatase/5'-nucleotidase [Chitinophagales bacterium]